MADLFVSYKRTDRAAVERIATALRGLGFDVWFDASLSAGESFADEIQREVQAAKVILVCWSLEAVESRWVKAETQIGFGKDNLVSTQVSGPDTLIPPVPFNSIHMEDLREWARMPSQRDPAWLSVLSRIGRLTERHDVAGWAALGRGATLNQVDAWVRAHGSTSPLAIEVEGLLREIEAEARQREAERRAARERLERERAERAAREAEERARREEERARREKEKAKQRMRRVRRHLIGWPLLVGIASLPYFWFADDLDTFVIDFLKFGFSKKGAIHSRIESKCISDTDYTKAYCNCLADSWSDVMYAETFYDLIDDLTFDQAIAEWKLQSENDPYMQLGGYDGRRFPAATEYCYSIIDN